MLIQRFVLFLGFPTYALSVVLFAMLLFGGVGSSISSRFIQTRQALLVVLGGIALVTVVGAFGLQPLLRSLIALPFAARVAVSIALIGPVSVGLGMAMPVGLRRFEAMHPTGVPYAWGVNGIASVVASVLGVALALHALVCVSGAPVVRRGPLRPGRGPSCLQVSLGSGLSAQMALAAQKRIIQRNERRASRVQEPGVRTGGNHPGSSSGTSSHGKGWCSGTAASGVAPASARGGRTNPIRLVAVLVNQMFPSGPEVIPKSPRVCPRHSR